MSTKDFWPVLDCARTAVGNLVLSDIDRLAKRIQSARRVFTLGLGGSASHASHCACDLQKLAHVNAVCLVDNVAALTAGFNDDGSEVFVEMLRRARFDHDDLLLIFSVGGGDIQRGVSVELVQAAKFTRGACAAIVGRRGDLCEYTDPVVQIVCPEPSLITPVVESIMPLIWHALVAGPLKKAEPVWK